MFDAKVASVAVQVIDPVAKPPNNRVNVPPVGVPPIVTVCTHDVPGREPPRVVGTPGLGGELGERVGRLERCRIPHAELGHGLLLTSFAWWCVVGGVCGEDGENGGIFPPPATRHPPPD